MNEVQALPVAEVDYKWPDDELVVRLSDYDALAAECERLLRMNKGYEATLTRVDNMWKKRWLEKTGEPAIALIVDDEFKSYFEEIKALKAKVAALESQQAASVGGERDGFERYRIAAKFCEARGIAEESPNRATVVDAFCSGYGFGLDSAALSPAGGGVVMPERWSVPRPLWKDARQPYGDPLNKADIGAAEAFNLALDEVARLNAKPQANSQEAE